MLLLSHLPESRRLSRPDCTVGATGSGLLAVNRGCVWIVRFWATSLIVIGWPKVLSPFAWTMIYQRCYWRCCIDIYIFTFIAVMICVWCHSKFWSTLRFTTIHFIFTVVWLFWAVLPFYSILNIFSVFCYPSRGWHSVVTSVQQLQGIFYSFTCETHHWADILHWFFSWSYLCTWNVWPRWHVRL